MTQIFHHTDTARLPYILRADELRPGANRIGDFPDPDFLWGTTDPTGDMTASADRGEHYRSGKTRHVRFVCSADDFMPWTAAPDLFPQWSPDHVARLHAATRGRSNPANWWCRAEALPLDRCLAIESRSYRDNRWRPIPHGLEVCPMRGASGEEWLALVLEGTTFASRRLKGRHGQDAYEVRAARCAEPGRAA